MFQTFFKTLNTLSDRLRGHTLPLPYEQICIDAWRNSLSPKAQEILTSQLASVRLIQRQAKGGKLCFYYPAEISFPLFVRTEPDLHVATIILREKGVSKDMKVRVFVHRGRFFSIEFPKRPSRYAQQHQMDLANLSVFSVVRHVELD